MPKIATLNKTRHGVFYVRRTYKDAQNKRHIQKISLHTKDPATARVLALKFALQQHAQTMEKKNPSLFETLRDQIAQPLKITTALGEVLDFDPSNPAEVAYAEKVRAQALEEAKAQRETASTGATLADTDREKLANTEHAFRQAEAEAMRYRASLQAPPVGLMLAEVIPKHLEEEARRGLVHKTMLEKQALFADLLECFGDVPLNTITKAEISARWRSMEYRRPNGKDPTKKRSGVTLEKRRGYLAKFFDWAYEAGYYHHDNPATQKMATKAEIKAQRKPWEEFSREDVAALFGPTYAQEMDKPDFYWLPFMALFSGARLGELARLELSTFEEVDGVKCYRITDTKTTDGRRTVPIHSQLLALGLWQYVQARKKAGELFLMPHRPQDAPGTPKAQRTKDPEKATGRAWGLWVERCGITNPQKVFHSFRSTAITDLHNANAGHAAIKRSVGHTGQGMTGAHAGYVRGIELVNLQTAVELLKHSQVNFEALKLDDPTFSAFFANEEIKKKNPAAIDRAEKLARHEAAKAAREERNRDKRKKAI